MSSSHTPGDLTCSRTCSIFHWCGYVICVWMPLHSLQVFWQSGVAADSLLRLLLLILDWPMHSHCLVQQLCALLQCPVITMIGVLFLLYSLLACSFLAPTSGMGAKRLTPSLQHFTCSLCWWYVHAHTHAIAAMCGQFSATPLQVLPNWNQSYPELTFLILRCSNSPFCLNLHNGCNNTMAYKDMFTSTLSLHFSRIHFCLLRFCVHDIYFLQT